MTCERAIELLDAWVDGELDPLLAREMEWHVQECAACARQLAARRALQRAVQMHVQRYRAPDDLRAGVKIAEVGKRNRWRTAALSLAACLLVGIGTAAWLALNSRESGHEDEATARWVVSSHLRALQMGTEGGRMVEVASSDRHTVKPWFAGKLSFAPTVRDLKSAGFPLLGGRLEMIDQHPAAGLVYQRDKHFISLLMWPTAEGDEAPAAVAVDAGYHAVYWVQGGMCNWAISDMDQAGLDTFARAFLAPDSTTKPVSF